MKVQDSARAAAKAIISRQQEWAKANDLRLDGSGWLVKEDADQNLVVALSAADKQAFLAGAGNELATKMRAPHSSSALAYNCFAAARGSNNCLHLLAPLTATPGVPPRGTPTVSFERKRPTGWSGIPPHLDVEVAFGDNVNAIESKMTEPYVGKRNPAKSLAPYLKFGAKSPRWAGMMQLRKAAELLSTGAVTLDLLDAPQLIKHALGLRRAQRMGAIRSVRLMFLWFDARELTDEACAACEKLLDELEWFRSCVSADITLVGMTHQSLIRAYRKKIGHAPWVSWLVERYL